MATMLECEECGALDAHERMITVERDRKLHVYLAKPLCGACLEHEALRGKVLARTVAMSREWGCREVQSDATGLVRPAPAHE